MDNKHHHSGSTTIAATTTAVTNSATVSSPARDLLSEAAENGKVMSVADMLMEWGRVALDTMEIHHKMYILVNNDLKMGKGKLCAQVGHAVAAWIRRLEKSPTDAYKKWVAHLEPKIVLKAELNVILALRKRYQQQTEIVVDAGLTQIAPGSITVLAFAPLHLNDVPSELHSLKLL